VSDEQGGDAILTAMGFVRQQQPDMMLYTRNDLGVVWLVRSMVTETLANV